jgi:hypothetical protein
MGAQTLQNNLVIKMIVNHETSLMQLSKQVSFMKSDLRDKTRTVEA